MQQTPYQHINHHFTDRHIFTVAFHYKDELHRKQYTPTEIVPIEKALENAVRYRNSVLGEPDPLTQTQEERQARRFLARLMDLNAESTTASEPIPKAPTPAAVKPTYTPIRMVEPRKPRKAETRPRIGRPKQDPRYRLAKLDNPNARYPSLPGGVYPRYVNNKSSKQPQLSFEVSVANAQGQHRVKAFYVGIKGKISLVKYRAVRHVAIAYREEFVASQKEQREFNKALFDRWQDKLQDQTFHKPFSRTLPRFISAPGINQRKIKRQATRSKRHDQPYVPISTPDRPGKHGRRFSRTNDRWPSLPGGVSIRKETGAGMDASRNPAIMFSVTYCNPRGKTSTRTFYIGLVGHLRLSRYRLVRHVAVCFRQEYLDAVEEHRPMRLDYFDNWFKKVQSGTFHWPYQGSIPTEWHAHISERKTAKVQKQPGLTPEQLRLRALETGTNERYPGLPPGVVPYMTPVKSGGQRNAVLVMKCYFRNQNSKYTQAKTFMVAKEGEMTLTRYRMARHAAVCMRQEYVDSVRENRAMRLELFSDWYNKMLDGTFAWPFKGTVPKRVVVAIPVIPPAPKPKPQPPKPTPKRKTAISIMEFLAAQPELSEVLGELGLERKADILESVRKLIIA